MNRWIITATAAAALVVGQHASPADYDFNDDDKNDMAAAWTGCEDQYWEPQECAMVQAKCWKRPLTYRRNGKTYTYCKEDPIFSGSEEDGQQALDDAHRMLGIEPQTQAK